MKKNLQLFLLLFVCCVTIPAAAQQSVTSLILFNADTDVPIRTLVNGDVLNYSTLPTRNLNIVANTSPATVGCVVFLLNTTRVVENSAPYAFAGDYGAGTSVNYKPIMPSLAPGAYTLIATPYVGKNGTGTAGTARTVSFTVVENSTTNQPPAANAGADKILTSPANSTTLNGSGNDPEGGALTYLWTKQSGPAATLANATTPNLSATNLVAGTYIFRLTVADNGGATAFDEATVTVSASSGTTPAVTSFTLINADNEQDIRMLVNGDVLNYSTLPTVNLNIRANTNPASVGSVVFFLNGVRKNENQPPYSYAGESVSGNNINYNKLNPPLAAGAHTLSATAYSSNNGGGTAGATLAISFTVAGTTANLPPTANAGVDKTLTLPVNSTTLNGSGNDPEGNAVTYLWTKQSGSTATLANATTPNLSVSNLVADTYIFRLTVMDNLGATGYDEAIVVVNNSGNPGGGNCAIYNEQNGLVVIEIESQPVVADWTQRTEISGYTGSGYYEWRHGNTTTSALAAGTGILTYSVQINNPGRYRLQIRSAAPQRTDFNDVWIKFPEGNGFGIKNSSTLTLGASWFKVYHNVSNNNWSWETKTKDHDPHDIFVDFPSAGIYRVQFSGRSNQFKIDRFVLYKTPTSTSAATSTSNPQSACAGSTKNELESANTTAASIELYPNPSSGEVNINILAEQEGKGAIQIFNTQGALVSALFEGNMLAGERKQVVFDGSNLPRGMYFARCINSGKTLIHKIILQ